MLTVAPPGVAPPPLASRQTTGGRRRSSRLSITRLFRRSSADEKSCARHLDDRTHRLVELTVHGEADKIRTLLASGEVPGKQASHGLLAAASWGRAEIVMSLLAHGANPRCTDGAGNTPLHLACASSANPAGAFDTVVKLFEGRHQVHALATVKVANAAGQTPLHLALAEGLEMVVQFLLSYGKATVDAAAIGHAVRSGHTSLVPHLVAHSAWLVDGARSAL